jgi:small nuclear ribonucleoprotein D3
VCATAHAVCASTSGRERKLTSTAAEDNMNVQLKDITVTARDGRVSHLDQVYIRGSHVRYFIVPDMLRYVYLLRMFRRVGGSRTYPRFLQTRLTDLRDDSNAPMFRQKDRKGRGVGLARGRATVSRARGQQRGGGGRP